MKDGFLVVTDGGVRIHNIRDELWMRFVRVSYGNENHSLLLLSSFDTLKFGYWNQEASNSDAVVIERTIGAAFIVPIMQVNDIRDTEGKNSEQERKLLDLVWLHRSHH